MELYHIAFFGIMFFVFFTGLGWAILSLMYTWLRIKIIEIKDKVGH